jgi:hypothetical protein
MTAPGAPATPVPLRVALAFAAEAEARGVPYAIGGALALGVWGYPRGTLDVDLNVFVEPAQLDAVFDALQAVGATVDRVAARSRAERDGMFVATLAGMQLDVFTPSIPFSHEAARTRRRVHVEALAQSADFLSAEAIAVFKLLFFRGKDRVDLERLVASQPALDVAYVRARLVEMLGEDDVRVAFWDEQRRRFRPDAPAV